ncbi:MAG: ATP-binding protein [Thiovulaceae bacterium]|nr:ATP-binding protein [Sulfurimonadaceae bacterium]
MSDKKISEKLRRTQAEKIVQKKMDRVAEHIDDLSHAETQRMVYELQVHQVELEMQNEELVRTQAALDETRRRYFDLYNMAPVGYCTLDDKGLILQANLAASTLLGIPRAHLLKQPLSRFILKEDQDIYYFYSKQLFESGRSKSCELRVVDSKKRQLWVQLTSSPGENSDGSPLLRLVLSDISESKRLEDELLLKDQMIIVQSRQAAMGEMISMIAHQWRQPLNIAALAITNIETTQSLHLLDEKVLDANIDIISKNISYMSNTIDDFRNFFKPECSKEWVTIGDVLGSIVAMIGQSLENENISLKIEDNSHTPLLIYKSSLIQVLLNIINNAKDEFQAKGVRPAVIIISANQTQEAITIKICDNAGGIPPAIINKLDQPYFTTKKLNGTGLGLHISQTIIEKHLSGTFSWHNEFGSFNWQKEKGGACFVITLKTDSEPEE